MDKRDITRTSTLNAKSLMERNVENYFAFLIGVHRTAAAYYFDNF
jgi:hypothetical protein